MRKQPKPPLNDTFPTPREPWTERGFSRFIKDRPYIWWPPVWGFIALWVTFGEWGTFAHIDYLTKGGQPNFLSFFFPVCTISLAWVVWMLLFGSGGEPDPSCSCCVLFALIGIAVGSPVLCMIAWFIGTVILYAIVYAIVSAIEPAIIAGTEGVIVSVAETMPSLPFFADVGAILWSAELVMLPIVCYSLLALMIASIKRWI